jgi:glutathione S-transferase
MRARMALKLADIDVEIREISLREKPPHLLEISPKATVPVLVLADGMVIEESLEIMFWAFNNAQEKNDALQGNIHAPSRALVLMNDTEFKKNLDCYKYPERNFQRNHEKSQLEYRQQGEVFLQQLEELLQQNTFLFAAMPCFADYAIFPFIRQFAAVDSVWFETAAYPKLRAWLNGWLSSELFASVMQKQPTFK